LECFSTVNGFGHFEQRTILDEGTDRVPYRLVIISDKDLLGMSNGQLPGEL